MLLQLFLNALSNYSSDDLKYNNLTGNIFTTHPALIVKKVKNEPMQFDALQVKVDKQSVFNFSAIRFNGCGLCTFRFINRAAVSIQIFT